MDPFVAVVLVCLNSVPQAECDEANAADVHTVGVSNEVGCVTGWQEIIARTPLATEVGTKVYLKTLCRRSTAQAPTPPGARTGSQGN